MKVYTSIITVFLCVDFSLGKPYTNDEAEAFELGAKTELRHQQVSYTLGGHNDQSEANVARFDDEEDGRDDFLEDEEDLELQRATTFTSPVVPMEFRDTFRKKPKKKNLNKKKLLKKMGTDFNAKWMSLEKPQAKFFDSNGDDDDDDNYKGNNLDMQMDILSDQLSDMKDLEGLDERTVNVFQNWLLKKASCPVTYAWTDLGEFFWPRYLRMGHCGIMNDTKTTADRSQTVERGCSWPEGMKCVQGESQVFHLLRWHCRAKRQYTIKDLNKPTNFGKRRKCQWYKVPYPVTLTCKCSCSN